MRRIVVAGVVNIRSALAVEEFPVPLVSTACRAGTISIRVSGSGYMVARTVQRLGTDVRFATYVGSDPLGRFVAGELGELAGPGVLACADQPRAVVLYDRNGTRSNTSDLRVTPGLRYPAAVFETLVKGGCDLAVLTNISFTRPLIASAIRRGIPIATDLHVVRDMRKPHNQEWMRAARILACSHEQLPVSPAQWVRDLWAEYGTELVLIGCGASGAVLGIRGRSWRIEAVAPRGVRYTSGAGDTLLGSFVHYYLSSDEPLTAARHAVLTAGWYVGGLPDESEPLTGSHRLPEVNRLQ